MDAVLDYRTAQWAVETFNDLDHGAKTMDRNPHLMKMLLDMVRATGASEAEAAAALESTRNKADSEDLA